MTKRLSAVLIFCFACSPVIAPYQPWKESRFYPKDATSLTKESAIEELTWVFGGCARHVESLSYSHKDVRTELFRCKELAANTAYHTQLRQRIINLSPHWSAAQKKTVMEAETKIGATPDMMLAVLGSPQDKKTTVVKGRTVEQWIYATGIYAYFTNGVLSGYQY